MAQSQWITSKFTARYHACLEKKYFCESKTHNFKKNAGKALGYCSITTGLTGCLSGLTGIYHNFVSGLSGVLSLFSHLAFGDLCDECMLDFIRKSVQFTS